MTTKNQTNEYLSTRELARMLGLTRQALQKRINNPKYGYIVRQVSCNGGKKLEILVSSLEEDLQRKVYAYCGGESISANITNAPFSLTSSLNSAEGGTLTHTPSTISSAPFSFEKSSLNNQLHIRGRDCQPPCTYFSPVSLDDEKDFKFSPVLTCGGQKTNKNAPLILKENLPYRTAELGGTPDGAASFFPEKAKEIALAKVDVVRLWTDFRKDKAKKSADFVFIESFNSGVLSTRLFEIIGKISIKSLYRWQKALRDNNNDYTALIGEYKYASENLLQTSLTEFERQAFCELYYRDSKLDFGSVYQLLKFQFERQGLKIKSEATFRRFKNYIEKNYNDINVLARRGEKALKDSVAPYIRRDISSFKVGEVFVADGNKLDFQVINPFTGRPTRAIWIVFFDWVSGDVAGSEIMLSENTQAISSALRNAILRLKKIPKIVYLDNGGAFKSQYFKGVKGFEEVGLQGVYEALGITVKFAAPYNGRAKIVERFFRDFSKTCTTCVSSYIGNSIENRPARYLRNEKFHKALHKGDIVPTIEQAKIIIERWLDFYRQKPCKNIEGVSIGEAFSQAKGEDINIDMLDELMMSSEIRSVRRSTIKLFGMEYESAELYGKTGKFLIKYSLFDLSQLKVYTLKGDYVGTAQTVETVNAFAKETGSMLDVYNLKRKLKEQKALIKGTQKRTKAVMGQGSFLDINWAKLPAEKIVKLEEKTKKKSLQITIYEDLHKKTARF